MDMSSGCGGSSMHSDYTSKLSPSLSMVVSLQLVIIIDIDVTSSTDPTQVVNILHFWLKEFKSIKEEIKWRQI